MDVETKLLMKANSSPRELSLRDGESLYDILVRIVPAIRWTAVRAEWEVRETARAADGTAHTTYRRALKFCCTREHEGGSVRDKMTTFQREVEESARDYEIFIHDEELVPVFPNEGH